MVFSVLTHIGSDALLYHFVDGRLLGLAETLAKIVEQYPNIIEDSGEGVARSTEVGRSKREQHELQDVTNSLQVFPPDAACLETSQRDGITTGSRSRARSSPSGEPRV